MRAAGAYTTVCTLRINQMITEGSIIEYRCEHGYNLKGKVSQVYTSVTGKRCVELTSGVRIGLHECRLLK